MERLEEWDPSLPQGTVPRTAELSLTVVEALRTPLRLLGYKGGNITVATHSKKALETECLGHTAGKPFASVTQLLEGTEGKVGRLCYVLFICDKVFFCSLAWPRIQ